MKLSREDVLRVAELAHLALTESELSTYREQLEEILTYIEKLKEIDVSQVEPMAQVLYAGGQAGNPSLREDELLPCDVAEAVLAGAADSRKPYFRVPKVIER
jgi:aspartyl-tRNA(Asn)/glutamyl-tRNA(Gln) amidotransferase subunit C